MDMVREKEGKNMKFDELREKYKSISYDKYEYSESENSFDIDYYFTLGKITFIHKISIIKKEFFVLDNLKDKDVFLFNLGIAELISYYKSACPKKVILKAGSISDEQ